MSYRGQPGQIGTVAKSAPGLRDPVLDRLDALERSVRELATARSGDYTTITSTLMVAGLTVGNTLTVPPGSIDSSALASEVTCRSLNGFSSVGAIPTTSGTLFELFGGDITVPTGFTSAHVFVSADVGASNSTGGGLTLSCAASVDASYINTISQGVAAGLIGSASSSYSVEITSLVGGDLIHVAAYGGADSTGLVSGSAHLGAQVIFLR